MSHRSKEANPIVEDNSEPMVGCFLKKSMAQLVSNAVIKQDNICAVEEKEKVRGYTLVEMYGYANAYRWMVECLGVRTTRFTS